MKVNDFLNQAYLLRTGDDPKKRAELASLQNFVNSSAEVMACDRGLLVQDFKTELETLPHGGRLVNTHGVLYLIDGGRMVQLTGDESQDKSDELLAIFMSNKTYYYNSKGPEKFVEDYKAGKLDADPQPGEDD